MMNFVIVLECFGICLIFAAPILCLLRAPALKAAARSWRHQLPCAALGIL
ncbi:MAG: hypothetical protein HDT14_00130 [Oscillibacter sp.]|nr:hypothetical protein [Oscillibacter sp.]